MLNGLIGKKLGMTQLTDAHGRVRAVTVVQLGPCTVTQLKAQPTDGYDSVQVTWGKKKLSRVSAAERGHFTKANVAAGVKTAEFKKRGEGELVLGQSIAVSEVFKAGEQVDVQGVSKGRATRGLSAAIISRDFPARAARMSISVTAVRLGIVPIRDGCARVCAWPVSWGTRPPPCSTSKSSRFLPKTTRSRSQVQCPAPTERW
jgi:hypothetical protein